MDGWIDGWMKRRMDRWRVGYKRGKTGCFCAPPRWLWPSGQTSSAQLRGAGCQGKPVPVVGCRRCWGATGSAAGWQEVSRYRLALKRMAGDLLSLRRHVTSLEVENGHLRRRLAGREEPGGALLADVDVDVMTREEVLDRLATLKGELVSGTMEMRRLKDRVQRLQNELIRNDREKELVLLQRAHRQQQAALRRCQEQVARTKGLEEMVRQQEKVIEVMERVLQDRLSMSTEKPTGDLHALLLAENRRLREELARPPRPPSPPMAPRASHGTRNIFGGTEKLSLLARLEEAQARGRVMERQLEEAARRWGREKQELGMRLLEREHGFGGSAPHSPHVPTSKQPPGSTFSPRRPRTLDPLP
ncbi:coiled-coil domain-containing protein 33 isoform X4 [Anser cygnoides]|uniref:coiled-coil domain-containing protein 33 isoform X4 n=1 Tax=Anser cygnoides TaxID=8845 RepID=UPI0034D22DD5